MEIKIRHIHAEDYVAVHQIFLSTHVINGTMRLPHQPPEYTQKRLAQSDEVIKLAACVDDEVVGYAELVTHPHAPRHRHAGEINMIVVHADWQGKGVGQALMWAMIDLADNWLQLNRLSLSVWASNKTAMCLYRKCGFVVEGIMKNYVFGNGKYTNACLMARVKCS